MTIQPMQMQQLQSQQPQPQPQPQQQQLQQLQRQQQENQQQMQQFSEMPQPVRLIVQGDPPKDGSAATSLEARLRGLQTTLGFRYVVELREHLGNYRVDIGTRLNSLPNHHLLEVTAGTVSGITTALIRQFPDVLYVEPDVDLHLLMPFIEDSVNFPVYRGSILASQKHNATGSRVKVAVIDSGSEQNANIIRFYDLVDLQNANRQNGPAYLDQTGHGTSMATIINTIAPGAEVYAIRVSKSSNKLKPWDLIAGIGTASVVVNANIVNLSLGCKDLGGTCQVCGGASPSRSAALENMITAIHSRSVAGRPVFVAATGNANASIPNDATSGFEWPARFESVLAVGALTESTSSKGKLSRSSYSKTGTTKTNKRYVVCPGGETLAGAVANVGDARYTDASGTAANAPISGTSPAAAFASAILARYDEHGSATQNPLTGDDLLALAFNDCKRDLDPSYQEPEHGRGRLVFDPP